MKHTLSLTLLAALLLTVRHARICLSAIWVILWAIPQHWQCVPHAEWLADTVRRVAVLPLIPSRGNRDTERGLRSMQAVFTEELPATGEWML